MMDKQYLSFRNQALLILERGMGSSCLAREELADEIERRLQYINYYRLSAYWYPFRIMEGSGRAAHRSNHLRPGTQWETVWQYYLFDRRLRNLLFDAIAGIEIALRTRLAYHWAERHKRDNHPQSNLNSYKDSFLKIKAEGKPSPKEKLLQEVNKYYNRSHTDCALHYKVKYGITDAALLPVWVFMEFTTLGNLRCLIQDGVKHSIQDNVKEALGFRGRDFFLSAVSLLNEARNTCAHQGRLWNLKWKYMQGGLTPDGHLNDILKEPDCPEWHFTWNSASGHWEPSGHGPLLAPDKSSTAALLTVCAMIMEKIAPESHWKERVCDLFDNTPLPSCEREVGFGCKEWRNHPLWLGV